MNISFNRYIQTSTYIFRKLKVLKFQIDMEINHKDTSGPFKNYIEKRNEKLSTYTDKSLIKGGVNMGMIMKTTSKF